jgi:hypothetical protein
MFSASSHLLAIMYPKCGICPLSFVVQITKNIAYIQICFAFEECGLRFTFQIFIACSFNFFNLENIHYTESYLRHLTVTASVAVNKLMIDLGHLQQKSSFVLICQKEKHSMSVILDTSFLYI